MENLDKSIRDGARRIRRRGIFSSWRRSRSSNFCHQGLALEEIGVQIGGELAGTTKN